MPRSRKIDAEGLSDFGRCASAARLYCAVDELAIGSCKMAPSILGRRTGPRSRGGPGPREESTGPLLSEPYGSVLLRIK